jgi:hypothetical protein
MFAAAIAWTAMWMVAFSLSGQLLSAALAMDFGPDGINVNVGLWFFNQRPT